MRTNLCRGKLKTWKDDRGFGFIQPVDGGKEVYLHISGLKNPTRRPQENDTIYYQTIVKSDGKARAYNAFISDAGIESILSPNTLSNKVKSSRLPSKPIPIAQTILLLLVPGLGAIHFVWVTKNPTPFILYPVVSILTYLLYADDKSRAKQNMWRTPEQTLHLFELAGGWIGGFLAQQTLRHKSQKPTYQSIFWLIVTIHHIAWFWWFLFGRLLFK